MPITRTAFQRIALVVLAFCVVALLGPKMVQADHDHIEVELNGPAFGADHDTRKPQQASRSSSDEVFLDRSFTVSSGEMLRVELASADLVVRKGASATQARIMILGNGRDAAEEFTRQRFEVDYDDGTLLVRSNPERNRRSGHVQAGFTVEVTIPARFNAEVSMASGDILLEDLVGTLNLTTASGDVNIETVQGPSITIQAASGDVIANRLDGWVSISTASGDIEIQQVIGPSAELNVASGDILVQSIEADLVEVNSASGDVTIERLMGQVNASTASGDVTLGLADAAAISTASGAVTLHIPRGAGFDVDLESPDVEIDGDLEFRGSRRDRRTQGTIGSGGPSLSVSTHSGSVQLDTE